jgi:hypothetical protein
MTLEETEKIIEKLNSMIQLYGVGGLILILLLIFGGFLFWKFLIKRTEKIANEISEKKLKEFQSELDKGIIKFSSKHQKQIDAVQDCYQKFQELQSFINFVIKGDKFTAQMQPDEEVKYLASYRLEFKRSYSRNHILLPKNLNSRIEELLAEIDQFLEDYIDGLLPFSPQDNIPAEERSDIEIAGIWSVGKLEPTLEKMEEISKGIESEFRKIYGTDEK